MLRGYSGAIALHSYLRHAPGSPRQDPESHAAAREKSSRDILQSLINHARVFWGRDARGENETSRPLREDGHMRTWIEGGGARTAAAVNRWLWPRLLRAAETPRGALLLGSGSGLSAGEEAFQGHTRVVVFGAGARDGRAPADAERPGWDLRFVRGPETARLMGLPPERWLCDPAVMIARLMPRDAARGMAGGRVGFMPGGLLPADRARKLAEDAGLMLIEATPGRGDWLHALAGCRALICADPSSAAAADGWGIPWRPLVVGPEADAAPVLSFQWRDWARSMGLRPSPLRIPDPGPATPDAGRVVSLFRHIEARRAAAALRAASEADLWSLSDRTLMRLRQQALFEEWERLREDLTPAPRMRVAASPG